MTHIVVVALTDGRIAATDCAGIVLLKMSPISVPTMSAQPAMGSHIAKGINIEFIIIIAPPPKHSHAIALEPAHVYLTDLLALPTSLLLLPNMLLPRAHLQRILHDLLSRFPIVAVPPNGRLAIIGLLILFTLILLLRLLIGLLLKLLLRRIILGLLTLTSSSYALPHCA